MVEFNEILTSIDKENQKGVKVTDTPLASYQDEPILNKKQIETLNAALTIRLMALTEKLYFKRMQEKPLSFNPGSKADIWDQVEKEIYELMCQALEHLTDSLVFSNTLRTTLLSHQVRTLQKNLKELMHGMFLLIDIDKICYRYDCIFLRHFYQTNHPRYYLNGPQCVGVFFDWAHKLWTNPPTQFATPSKQCAEYFDVTSTLMSNEFPREFPAKYSFLGDPCLNENTALLQKVHRALFSEAVGKPAINSSLSDGKALFYEAVRLFEKNDLLRKRNLETSMQKALEISGLLEDEDVKTLKDKPHVSVLEASLGGTENKSHMIGIAKITFGNTSVYRLIDANTGEFEARCPKKFGEWLQQYFIVRGYDKTHTKFTMRIVDHVLGDLPAIVSKLTAYFKPKQKVPKKIPTSFAKQVPVTAECSDASLKTECSATERTGAASTIPEKALVFRNSTQTTAAQRASTKQQGFSSRSTSASTLRPTSRSASASTLRSTLRPASGSVTVRSQTPSSINESAIAGAGVVVAGAGLCAEDKALRAVASSKTLRRFTASPSALGSVAGSKILNSKGSQVAESKTLGTKIGHSTISSSKASGSSTSGTSGSSTFASSKNSAFSKFR